MTSFQCKLMSNSVRRCNMPNTILKYKKPLKALYTKVSRGSQSGDPSEARTPDTLLKRQVLCQLS